MSCVLQEYKHGASQGYELAAACNLTSLGRIAARDWKTLSAQGLTFCFEGFWSLWTRLLLGGNTTAPVTASSASLPLKSESYSEEKSRKDTAQSSSPTAAQSCDDGSRATGKLAIAQRLQEPLAAAHVNFFAIGKKHAAQRLYASLSPSHKQISKGSLGHGRQNTKPSVPRGNAHVPSTVPSRAFAGKLFDTNLPKRH